MYMYSLGNCDWKLAVPVKKHVELCESLPEIGVPWKKYVGLRK
jgi:hypothetical protein